MNTEKIKSAQNPRLKLVRSVRDGRDGDLIFIEGIRMAEEAIATDLVIKFAVIEEGRMENEREKSLMSKIQAKNIQILETDHQVFNSLTDTKSSQGILLLAERPNNNLNSFEAFLDSINKQSLQVIVFLSQINNPSNLGAVIRTVEAAGAVGLIIGRESADPFSPKALRGAMGSAFRVPIWRHAELEDVVKFAMRNAFHSVGASLNGRVAYTEYDWTRKSLLVLGSEAHGIHRELADILEIDVQIPLSAQVESLNLAVATGILLFEARRQNFQKLS